MLLESFADLNNYIQSIGFAPSGTFQNMARCNDILSTMHTMVLPRILLQRTTRFLGTINLPFFLRVQYGFTISCQFASYTNGRVK